MIALTNRFEQTDVVMSCAKRKMIHRISKRKPLAVKIPEMEENPKSQPVTEVEVQYAAPDFRLLHWEKASDHEDS